MHSFLNWLRRLARWFAEPRGFWLFAFVGAAAVGLALVIPLPLADDLRFAGLALQLLGVSTVLRGLRDRGRLFDKPSVISSVRDWFSRLPPYKPHSVTLAASGLASATATASMDAVVWRGYREEESLENRFLALAENLDTVHKELDQVSARFANQVGNVQELVQREQSARMEEITRVQRKLAELGAGGLNIELVGVAWLVAGIVLATVPAEIAQLLQSAK